MAEKPILFSTPMVQALLDGRKTMTRRVIKDMPKGTYAVERVGECLFEARWGIHLRGMWFDGGTPIKPRYQPGDRLWVRETWAECATIDSFLSDTDLYAYKADFGKKEVPWKWRPSIFMPKAASRIWLTVTEVRVERLSEITEEDAIAEGIRIGIGGMPYFSCREAFAALWNSLNAKRGYGWDSNPWVWVISFEREG